MMQLSELLSARDTLQRAIFSGTRRVQFADRAVDYDSIDDKRKALADINAEIAKASGPVPPSFSLAVHSRE
jgi:hypothetical protein